MGILVSNRENNQREPFAIREGHDNFFTPLRLIFASLVVFGHSFGVALRDSSLEPHILYHYTFSYLAKFHFGTRAAYLPRFVCARYLRDDCYRPIGHKNAAWRVF